jgi:hypothetical protein
MLNHNLDLITQENLLGLTSKFVSRRKIVSRRWIIMWAIFFNKRDQRNRCLYKNDTNWWKNSLRGCSLKHVNTTFLGNSFFERQIFWEMYSDGVERVLGKALTFQQNWLRIKWAWKFFGFLTLLRKKISENCVFKWVKLTLTLIKFPGVDFCYFRIS